MIILELHSLDFGMEPKPISVSLSSMTYWYNKVQNGKTTGVIAIGQAGITINVKETKEAIDDMILSLPGAFRVVIEPKEKDTSLSLFTKELDKDGSKNN